MRTINRMLLLFQQQQKQQEKERFVVPSLPTLAFFPFPKEDFWDSGALMMMSRQGGSIRLVPAPPCTILEKPLRVCFSSASCPFVHPSSQIGCPPTLMLDQLGWSSTSDPTPQIIWKKLLHFDLFPLKRYPSFLNQLFKADILSALGLRIAKGDWDSGMLMMWWRQSRSSSLDLIPPLYIRIGEAPSCLSILSFMSVCLFIIPDQVLTCFGAGPTRGKKKEVQTRLLPLPY